VFWKATVSPGWKFGSWTEEEIVELWTVEKATKVEVVTVTADVETGGWLTAALWSGV